MTRSFLLLFAGICLYNTGNIWSAQLVHYPLYAVVPPAGFQAYLAGQNRRQIVPAIIPGVVQFLAALALPLVRPPGISTALVATSVALNLAIVAVTVTWSARTNLALERRGYDAALIDRLIRTNWIRTVCYTVQAVLVLAMLHQIIR